MNADELKPGEYCLVRVQVLQRMLGGVVVRIPEGPKVLIKQRYMGLVSPVEPEKEPEKKKVSRKKAER